MRKSQIEALKDGYYKLRRESSILKDADHRFEGKHWIVRPTQIERYADGWRLTVYKIEGEIEACLLNPNGTHRTYC
jgi:hypothetical protein